jgi:membrane-associated protease RseP (regulator of RpoE activity)
MVLIINRARMVVTLAASVLLWSTVWSAAGAAQQPTATGVPRVQPLLYGFALGCTDCEPGMRGRVGGAGRGAPPAVTYTKYPQIVAVAPGSAAERAGIHPGDELHTIDGLSFLSPEGAERFAHAAAGEHVALGFERDAKPISFSLVLGPPSLPTRGAERENTGYMAIRAQKLHGDLGLDFWSDQLIYVIPDSASGTITFQIGTGTIIRMKYTKDSSGTGNRRD